MFGAGAKDSWRGLEPHHDVPRLLLEERERQSFEAGGAGWAEGA